MFHSWPREVYYSFYHANAQRPWTDWTTNVARSRDLVHWEKYPGNPIIKNKLLEPRPRHNPGRATASTPCIRT